MADESARDGTPRTPVSRRTSRPGSAPYSHPRALRSTSRPSLGAPAAMAAPTAAEIAQAELNRLDSDDVIKAVLRRDAQFDGRGQDARKKCVALLENMAVKLCADAPHAFDAFAQRDPVTGGAVVFYLLLSSALSLPRIYQMTPTRNYLPFFSD